MYRILIILLSSLFFTHRMTARNQEITHLLNHPDSIPHIYLPEVVLTAKIKNSKYYKRQRQKYNRLVYHVRKTLPYAKIAARKIQEIEQKLSAIHTEAEKRRVIKKEYQQLMQTFKQPLMKLSITQGKILVRLIYRETRNTSFNHIQTYKGTVNAYFWQSIALLFGNNLKADYDPEGSDQAIEEIVRQLEKDRYFDVMNTVSRKSK